MNTPITLERACEVHEIPSGIRSVLPAGTVIRVTQSLGGSCTVADPQGKMFRLDETDAVALGLVSTRLLSTRLVATQGKIDARGISTEQAVWDELRTVFDPEIPVNIADLGLIYSCAIEALQEGGKRVEIKMTLTAPGCGMADVLKADVEHKLSRVPDVKEVSVEVVFEPPWNPGRMTEAAKLQLGLDLDWSPDWSPGPSTSALPILNSKR